LLRAPADEVMIGVAVNGVIGAVVESYLEDEIVRYQAMVPPDLLLAGDNEIQVVWISQAGVLAVPTR
jgi:hypothetical protein